MDSIELVEVGPRDGFQSVGPVIPTKDKIAILHALYAAGIRRVEATSFVSETAVPQMADAVEVLHAAQALEECDPQVLVPNLRHAERALHAGARHVAFVLSVSEAHNRSNVKRSPAESAIEYGRIVDLLPDGTKLRLNLATAFDCPYDGTVGDEATLALLEQLLPLAPQAEVALCDTTGRVVPSHVSRLFKKTMAAFPGVKWAFHAHDTYGLGVANTLTAYNAGVRVFDASVAGLGGCPFAPGATGNVATEDLLWMFEGMQVDTRVDANTFVEVARQVAAIPGGQTGGRVREALSSKRCAA